MEQKIFTPKNLIQKYFHGLEVNRTIQFMILSDILFLSGWGLVNPILAIFFADKISGGNVAIAGIASTIYLLIQSVLQIPIARLIDSKRGEQDDFTLMIIGSLVITFCPLLFIYATNPWHIYAIQALCGIGSALSLPSWYAIFTRHIDRNHEGLEWSIYNTGTGIGMALSAALGGLLADKYGYNLLFVIVSIMSLAGSVFLFGIAKKLKSQR